MTKADRAGGPSTADQFEAGELSAPEFHHHDHVRVAFAMLGKYEFIEATAKYAAGIRRMALDVGLPEKYNATITFAFMSLIAERMAAAEFADADAFIVANPDLMRPDVLSRWYSDLRLHGSAARAGFVLPDQYIAV